MLYEPKHLSEADAMKRQLTAKSFLIYVDAKNCTNESSTKLGCNSVQELRKVKLW